MFKRPYLWEKSYPEALSWDQNIAFSTLGQVVDEAEDQFSDLNAYDYNGKKITFKELAREIRVFAASLLAYKMQKETLALYLPNLPYHPFGFLGAAYAGVRLTHLSPLDAERVLKHKLKDAEARTIFTVNFPGMLALATKFLAEGVIDRVIVGEVERFGEVGVPLPDNPKIIAYKIFMGKHKPLLERPDVSPATVALIQYTGGTTGLPKGAMLTHKNLTAAISSYKIWFEGNGFARVGEDRVIGVLPLFHIYALTSVMLRNLQCGNEVLLHLRFDPNEVLYDIEVKRATVFPGVPTMWIALAAMPDIENRDFSSLRNVASGGAPMPTEIAAKVAGFTKLHMGGGWGMTETSPSGSNIPKHIFKKGTIGIPLPGIVMGIVKINDVNTPAAPNEIGELVIKSLNVFPGYLNQREATKRAFNKHDYFLTGDIGYMDEDGFFFLTDRKNDMIISGGFNVYPQMIEQVIYEHPAVLEAIVIGVSDDYRGEAAKAFISLKSGMNADDLMDFLKPRLGKHEMIIGFEVRENLPKTPVGKLSRAEMRKENSLTKT